MNAVFIFCLGHNWNEYISLSTYEVTPRACEVECLFMIDFCKCVFVCASSCECVSSQHRDISVSASLQYCSGVLQLQAVMSNL